ncbi:MAG: LPS export ABC transporter periplasmic protein LptC [gamma proteobacterium symbiont of Bathyaustriella thionipta]|nr:LPS export ABC transporter periplasmic protein LptC [gamma proteobacterium symbiont of Bathyaustriella thionipta]
MARLAFRLLLALLLAAVSWWGLQSTSEDLQPLRRDGHEAAFFIKDFAITALDEEGRPRHKLSAAKLEQFMDDDTTELTSPLLTVYDEGRPPWVVRSTSGWMSKQGELVLLKGDVLITRAASAAARGMKIVTRDMRLYPKKDYAEGDEKVRLSSNKDWLISNGFQLWFKKPMRLKLLKNVRGRYAPIN